MATVKSETQQLVEQKLTDILGFLGMTAEVDSEQVDNVLRVKANTNQDQVFTSGSADPLLALQHVMRAIFKKELTQESASLILDIGNFQKLQQQKLADVANSTAESVLEYKQSVSMKPMTSFERRIIHMVLSERDDVTTTSEGEGANHHIVNHPK